MARTALTLQTISLAGIAPSLVSGDAVNGHQFLNDGNTYLEVKNAGASAIDVTVKTPAKVNGLDIAEVVVSVPATSGDKIIGPFNPTIFNTAAGFVEVDLSSATSVTIGAFRLP